MANRISTGIAGLDELLDGGLLPNSSTLVRGAPGTGKTTLALQFLQHGAVERNEPGLLVSFEEFPESLYRDAESLELDIKSTEASAALTVQFTSPDVFLRNLQAADSPIGQLIRERGIKRVALDSASQFTRLTANDYELRKIYHTVINGLKREDTTILLLSEETYISHQSAGRGRLAFVVDCIIMLRFLEIDSAIERGLVVLKMRGSGHAKQIRRYSIQVGGIVVGEPFTGQHGLLSGLARNSMISTVRQQ